MRAHYSAACAGAAGSFQTSTGFLAASVSSSRRRGAKCGAVFSAGSAAFARAAHRPQRADELIQRRLRLGLGRLDQHRAMHDQREVHRHWMEALVDQPLGDVERREAVGEPVVAEQRLVHARPSAGERGVEHVVERAQHVVGVEHRVLGDLLQPVRAMAEHIGQRAGEHAHLAVERGHAAEAVRMILARGLLLDQADMAVRIARGEGQRPERAERLRQHRRPGPRPAATMRRAERFVQVDVHRIDTEIARPDLADDRVEVGAVAIDIAASCMDRVADPLQVALEQAAGVRVGDHHRGHIGSQPRLHRRGVDPPVRTGGNVLHRETGECRGCRVGAVRALGHQHDLARALATLLQRRLDAQHPA